MATMSRRSLAVYAAKQLDSGQPPAKLAKQLAAALIVSGHQHETDLLLDDISYELERRGLLASVKVVTATELTAELRKNLARQLKALTGAKQVALAPYVDKAVIGGLRLNTATRSWDKTIARKLAEIKGVA